MTSAILAFLIIGCIAFVAFVAWLLRPRREQKQEPMEYQEPRVFTRIWDGNINKEQ